MSSTLGKNIRLTLFGGGKDAAVGMTLDGLPIGIVPDLPKGEYKILSGMHGDKLNGTPLTVLFPAASVAQLQDIVSADIIRPGMGDLGEYKLSGGKLSLASGEHTLRNHTAPLLFAAQLLTQLLSEKKIVAAAHILRLGEVEDDPLEHPETQCPFIRKGELPVIDKRKEMLMKLCIAKAQSEQDTLGGQIEAVVFGLPAGVGAPLFDGIKSQLSAALFALPDVTAVEFGIGCDAATYKGSDYNDMPYIDTTVGSIRTQTNHCGGAESNMTNGMPLVIKVTFAPSPIIGKAQATVHRTEQRNTTLPPYKAPQTCTLKEMCGAVTALLALTIIDQLH
ncbi:MAG: chorismate synthase [Clostridia bacterium]|nr:chorismate synthase [Clostridia bacterium]